MKTRTKTHMKSTITLPSGTTGVTDDAGRWICTGSQMGRRNTLPEDTAAPVKLRLHRLPSVSVDYDRWGAYWGAARNVWIAWAEGVQIFVRATHRRAAKAAVLDTLRTAKFYR